ncbi:MAG: hypothetical protein ABI406_15940 [Ktedonobacteraceae bacterium]
MKSSAFLTTNQTTAAIDHEQKRGDTLLFAGIVVVVLLITPLLVWLGAKIGFSYTLGGVIVLAIVASIVAWPVIGFYMIAASALLVESEALIVNGKPLYSLYVFYWPPRYDGLIERPIGFLILFIFFVLICHRFVKRERLLYGGELFYPFLLFLLCVAYGVIHGLTSGGNLKIIVLEVRPFWYLFLSYLLAYNLITSKKHVRLFLWLVILSAGIKALEGVYIYAVLYHGSLLDHHEIMAHEESFFFIAIILLVVLFCLHYRYRPQLYAALAILPPLIVATVANQRRADYLALLIGILVAWILVFIVKPRARKWLAITLLITIILGVGYVAAFYKSSGSIGEPARAVVTVFYPDATEEASNLYRNIENYDLKYTLRLNPMGMGFGKEFLNPIPLPNILILDPYYLYIPHNTIYWVWMRLGPIGFGAFWYLIGAIIVRGCIIARRLRDRYLQLVAIFVVSVTVMEIIVAYADYQLYFYRNVIYLGLLAGILMKLPALDTKEDVPAHEVTRGNTEPALTNGRR